MKRKLGILFLSVVFFILLATGVQASEYTASPYREEINSYDDVFKKLYTSALSTDDRVSIAEYQITDNELMQIYSDLIASAPELFYLENKVVYYKNSRYVTDVVLSYTMSDGEIEKASRIYEEEIGYIVSLVDASLSDAEKALWVHDYMISAFEYDESGTYFDAYSLFTQRKGVCQAYSLAYTAVLRELGISSVMISSDEMNHAWNLVKIDGEWYPVDLAFDDPSPDRIGRVLHESFLLSDEDIKKTTDPHYGWSSIIRCRSDKYSDALWTNVRSRMIYFDEKWFYIDSDTMTLTATRLGADTQYGVYTFSDKWFADDDSDKYWVGIFSGVSEYLGHIFINTPYEVLIYNPVTGKLDVFLEPDTTKVKLVFGMEVYKGTLEYLLTPSPDDKSKFELGTFVITDFEGADKQKIFPFNDVTRIDSYYSAVKYVYNNGLFTGVSSTKFAPHATLTRAMFVTVLGRMCDIDTSLYTGSTFTDVTPGQWYSPYIEWAAQMGIVNGVGNSRFNPLGEITHEQMYKIIAKCGTVFNITPGHVHSDEPVTLAYADLGEISDWALEGVMYCAENNLIDNTEGMLLMPRDRATRADAAIIITGFAMMCGSSL